MLFLARGQLELVGPGAFALEFRPLAGGRHDERARLPAGKGPVPAIDVQLGLVVVLPLAAFQTLAVVTAGLRDPIDVLVALAAVPRLDHAVDTALSLHRLPPVVYVEVPAAFEIPVRDRRRVDVLDGLGERRAIEVDERPSGRERRRGLQGAVSAPIVTLEEPSRVGRVGPDVEFLGGDFAVGSVSDRIDPLPVGSGGDIDPELAPRGDDPAVGERLVSLRDRPLVSAFEPPEVGPLGIGTVRPVPVIPVRDEPRVLGGELTKRRLGKPRVGLLGCLEAIAAVRSGDREAVTFDPIVGRRQQRIELCVVHVSHPPPPPRPHRRFGSSVGSPRSHRPRWRPRRPRVR